MPGPLRTLTFWLVVSFGTAGAAGAAVGAAVGGTAVGLGAAGAGAAAVAAGAAGGLVAIASTNGVGETLGVGVKVGLGVLVGGKGVAFWPDWAQPAIASMAHTNVTRMIRFRRIRNSPQRRPVGLEIALRGFARRTIYDYITLAELFPKRRRWLRRPHTGMRFKDAGPRREVPAGHNPAGYVTSWLGAILWRTA